jgi:WD40 repeat protein
VTAAAAVAALIGLVSALVAYHQIADARTREILEARTRREVEVRALLERARQRLSTPTEGRRREAQDLLRAAGKPLALVPRATSEELLFELRSLYAATLAVPDLSEPREIDRLTRLPVSPFANWPVALHPDGKAMVIGTPKGPVYWQRGRKPTLPAGLDPSHRRPRLWYSPDGAHLVFAPAEGGLQVWDSEVKGYRTLAKAAEGAVLAVGFGPASKSLVSLRPDGRLRSWSLPGAEEAPARQLPVKDLGPITAAFNEAATEVALGNDAGGIALVDLASGKVRVRVQQRGGIVSLAWSPDSQHVAAATSDGLVGLWHADGTPSSQLGSFSLPPDNLLFSNDSRWLFVGHRNGNARAWDVSTGAEVLGCKGTPVGISRDGRTLATTGVSQLMFREVVYPEKLQQLDGGRTMEARITWSADHRHFATLNNRLEARVWDARGENGPRLLTTVRAPSENFSPHNAGLTLSADGRLLAYASGGWKESHVRVWETRAGSEVARWKLPGGFDQIASAGKDRFLLVREQFQPGKGVVDTVVVELKLGKPAGPGRVLRKAEPGDRFSYFYSSLTPDGRFYAWSGPRDGAARRAEVWDLASGKQVKVVPAKGPGETGVELSPDGRRLRVGQSSAAHEYDLTAGGPPVRVDQHQLAAARGGWTAHVTELGWRRELVAELRREGEPVLALSNCVPQQRSTFSGDGRFFLCAAANGGVWFVHVEGLAGEVDAFVKSLPARE